MHACIFNIINQIFVNRTDTWSCTGVWKQLTGIYKKTNYDNDYHRNLVCSAYPLEKKHKGGHFQFLLFQLLVISQGASLELD